MPFTLPLNAPAPDFSLPATDGNTYSLASFANSPLLVISFTCNHCPYVIGNESREKSFIAKYASHGIAYVAINANETQNHPTDDFAHMKQRADALGFTWPYLRDDTQTVAAAYGAIKTPHFYLFDRTRRLRYVGRMDNSPRDISLATTHELADAVDDLLAQRPVALPQTDAIGCTVKWWGKDRHFIPNDMCDLVFPPPPAPTQHP
jgi:peroxiredoxin